VIYGGAGKDWIFGDGGDDTLMGGIGDDAIFGGEGKNLIDGGDGNDDLNGGVGDDFIVGGAGNDLLYGAEYGETDLDGNDVLDGGAGNDTLNGGTGTDYLNGGKGNDTYQLAATDGNDTIDDESGTDTLELGIARSETTIFRSGSTVFLGWGGTHTNASTQALEYNNSVAILKGTEGIIETIRFTDSTLTATELLKSFAPGSYTNTTSSVANATMSTGGDLAKLTNTATATTANTTYQTQNSQLAIINDAGGTADTVDFELCDNMSHCWVEPSEIGCPANDENWRVAA